MYSILLDQSSVMKRGKRAAYAESSANRGHWVRGQTQFAPGEGTGAGMDGRGQLDQNR